MTREADWTYHGGMLAYLIRHAQSRANAQVEDALDSELSELGRKQVEALVRRFARTRLDAIYVSPYRRAIQTALPIARSLGLPARLRPELCEYHALEAGTRIDLCLAEAAALASQHEGLVLDVDAPGPCLWPQFDESYPSLLERMRALAAFLKQRWNGVDDTVMVISHGSPIARLIDAWLCDAPGPSFRFIIDNAAVNALRYVEGVSSLVCLNEISHLRGVSAPAAANYDEAGNVKPRPPSSYW